MPTTTPSGLNDAAIINGYVNNARDTASQALTGVADAGVTVTVYDGGALLGTATADSAGAWSYTLGRLLDGTHRLTAVANDAGGHLSAASEALVFKVDTRPPSQPGGLVDTGISKGLVNAAHNTADQALTGKTDAGATVAIFDDGAQIGTVKAGATGAWSFTLGQLSEGAHKLTATASDVAGNTSAASDVLSFTVDTHAPGAPTGLADTRIVGGYVNAAHDTASQALTGQAQAYAFVSVYDGATKLGQVQAGGTGDWSYTLGKLAEGDHSLTATASDKAGNVGPSSAALGFTVDTEAPPVGLLDVAMGDTPATLIFYGGTEPGSVITIFEGATKLASAMTYDEYGDWNLNLSGLTDRAHTFVVSAADPAGNKTLTTLTLYHGGAIVFADGDVALGGHAAAAAETLSYDYNNLPWSPSVLATLVGDVSALAGQAHGGDDVLDISYRSPTAIGDALSIADYAHGGDDQISSTTSQGTATSVGDAVSLSGHATGGDDTVSAATVFLGGSVSIGDANSMTDYARGGDDVVTAAGTGKFSLGNAFGDAGTMSGHAVGGSDTVTASVAFGDAGSLRDNAQGGDDVVTGEDHSPYWKNLLYGDGAELLDHASGGNDTVVGTDSAADQMWGDAATVQSTATTGADLFVIRSYGGQDEIMDFQPGKDRIEIDGYGLTGFADLSSHVQNTADGVLISLDDYNSVLVRGVTVAQLAAGDFVFG
jgi:hypothetical protein